MPSRSTALTLALSLTLAACGGAPDTSSDYGCDESALKSSNGLSTNGLSTNGMSSNGLSTNGLSTNGLSTNGLSTNGFTSWWSSNSTSYSNMVMTYVVRCALAAGQSLSYTSGGVTYTWQGTLGLAPAWAAGNPIPLVEKQLVSACLAAHANKYGVEVSISVRGFYKDGVTQIPADPGEISAYTVNEGCFFGNLFDGEGVFSAYEPSALGTTANSSYRACAWSNGGVGQCANLPATNTQCSAICSQLSGSQNAGIWKACTWNGKPYPPITTRIQATSLNFCGDYRCQPTESCYSATTGYGCQADCGKCP